MTEWALQLLHKEKLKTVVVQTSAFENHHIHSSSHRHSQGEHPGHSITPSTDVFTAQDIKPVPWMLPVLNRRTLHHCSWDHTWASEEKNFKFNVNSQAFVQVYSM